MKKYNLIEVLEELRKDNTKEFECFTDFGSHLKLSISENGYIRIKRVEEDEEKEIALAHNLNVNSLWTEIKKPVTFMEALKSNKNVLVEHRLIDSLALTEASDYYTVFKDLKAGKYRTMATVLESVSHWTLDFELKNIIINGKWYIEN